VKDFQTFARQTGHELLSHAEANREFTFFMKKKVRPAASFAAAAVRPVDSIGGGAVDVSPFACSRRRLR
jgi:hypothetical protein